MTSTRVSLSRTIALAATCLAFTISNAAAGTRDTDLEVVELADCFSGPDEAPDPSELEPMACLSKFDYDGDGDIDMLDYRVYHATRPVGDPPVLELGDSWQQAYEPIDPDDDYTAYYGLQGFSHFYVTLRAFRMPAQAFVNVTRKVTMSACEYDPIVCVSDGDCPEDQFCNDNDRCERNPTACAGDGDCEGDEACNPFTLLCEYVPPSCYSQDDCGEGQSCNDLVISPEVTFPQLLQTTGIGVGQLNNFQTVMIIDPERLVGAWIDMSFTLQVQGQPSVTAGATRRVRLHLSDE